MPPDTQCFSSDNGWINGSLFLKWLEFFVQNVRPSQDRPALLILDNHESHRSLEVINYARQNHVVMLSLPPHTSHRVQPLDVGVYSSFKEAFERQVSKWQKKYPGQVITLHEIGELFGNTYLLAATSRNAIDGFIKTGISECDINVFQERDFLPASVTGDNDVSIPHISPDKSLDSNELVAEEEEIRDLENSPIIVPPSIVPPSVVTPSVLRPSGMPPCVVPPDNCSPPLKTPQEIRPHPESAIASNKKRRSRTQRSEILTSTPVKKRLEDIKEKRKPKIDKKPKIVTKKPEMDTKKLKIEANPVPSTSKVKRRLSLSDQFLPKFPQKPKEPKKADPEPCLICDSHVSRSRETWLQCNMCSKWAHKDCTSYCGIGFYVCDFCVSAT